MARPAIKGLKYFPFDVGFFRDKKIRLLRGQHGADGVEIYQRILCACYEGDNGYYLPWNANEDYALMAEDTGHSEEKVRLIVSSCLNWSLFDDTLFMMGNVLTSRSIQRRYFGAIKDTKSKAAAQGRHTVIPRDICLLTEEDISEINKTTVWLKVGDFDLFSENNTSKSTNNLSKSTNNPLNKRKGNKSKLEEIRENEISAVECDPPPDGDGTAEEPPPIMTLTLNDKSEYPVYAEQIKEWAELYPAVNIIQQLRAMKGWLNANPAKRKTKKGILRFVNGWLTREQDKGGIRQATGGFTQQSSNPFLEIAREKGYTGDE